jgi:hypothetical protein
MRWRGSFSRFPISLCGTVCHLPADDFAGFHSPDLTCLTVRNRTAFSSKSPYRCYSNEKVVVEQKVVRSLRRCAPQRPIAELRLLLRLTPNVGPILCSTSRRFSNKGLGLHHLSDFTLEIFQKQFCSVFI